MAVYRDNKVHWICRILYSIQMVDQRRVSLGLDGIIHNQGCIPHLVKECIAVGYQLSLNSGMELINSAAKFSGFKEKLQFHGTVESGTGSFFIHCFD